MIPRLAAAVCLLVLGASCGPSQPDAMPSDVQVTVEMKEYVVTVSPQTVKAGAVKIGIRNAGTMPHQFDLIKTDLAVDKLPVDTTTAKAKEDGLVKQVLNIQPGRVATVIPDLAAGHYVIICNVAGHYQLKMYAELVVN